MKEEAISILKKYHQEHILEYNLSEKQQQELEKQILSIDFEQLQNLYESTKQEKVIEEKNLMLIKGAVPGNKGGIVRIQYAVKGQK